MTLPQSIDLGRLSSAEKKELVQLLELLDERKQGRALFDLYPDEGPLRRELYPKHLQFFAGGLDHMERCAMAANRVGKTWGIGGYESALHLTGRYPDWWVGRRFDHPIEAWAAGDTLTTTRDIVQAALLGANRNWGTGLIPREDILGEPVMRAGVTGGVDQVAVKHSTGGTSVLGFKAYDQGRKTFQGTEKHIVWLDEEPPEDVYEEALLRLATTNGLMLCTFTPLLGLSKVALKFLPELAPDTGG
jgi:phage terminase large subunit-like protein